MAGQYSSPEATVCPSALTTEKRGIAAAMSTRGGRAGRQIVLGSEYCR
jgi:hypothetical protein